MEKIKELEIVSDPYFGSVSLSIFPDMKSVSLVYGKNGSGKTSISNAFLEVKNGNSNYKLKNKESIEITITEEVKDHLYVFNEEYIDKRVRLLENTIGAIVLFGDTGNIEEAINDLEGKIKAEEAAIVERNIEKYHQKDNAYCIEDCYKKVERILQDKWAFRQQKIRKLSRKAPVNKQLIEEILSINITQKHENKLVEEYDELLKLVEKAKLADEIIPYLNIKEGLGFSEKEFVGLLNMSYERKEMSELAIKLITAYENYGLLDVTKKLINSSDDYCPVCLSPLGQEHNQCLECIIDEAFDDTIKNAQAKLKATNIEKISVNLGNYSKYIDPALLQSIQETVASYNSIAEQYMLLANQKIVKIYDSVNTAILGLQEVLNTLLELQKKLNGFLKTINEAITKDKENCQRLESLNKLRAAFEILTIKKSINELILGEKTDIKNNEISENNIKDYKSQIITLRAEAQNICVAMEEINKELAIIFSSKRRLRLVEAENNAEYYIESKGHKVKLNKLSTGERNLIALLYFFEEMKNECKQGLYFRDEHIIVIDDPISSFDYENKLGVYSYIIKMIRLIYEGNGNTQMIIFSHERDVVYFLTKALNKLRLASGAKVSHETLRISGKAIQKFSYEDISDYTYLMKEVFDFANIENIDDSFVSKGNEIRKLVEMYATFNYKVGVDALFTNEAILSNISDVSLREYYKNKLISTQLNADSHRKEIALQYPNFDEFDLFSEEEQIQVARNILCFLYLIHKEHVCAQLDNNEVEKIEKWLEALRVVLS